MRKGLDRFTQLPDGGKYPCSHNGGGANNNANFTTSSKKHPYLRPGFIFPCCQGIKHDPTVTHTLKVNDND